MKPRRDTQPVTIERLEHAKLLMAHIIDMDGDVYLPFLNCWSASSKR
jgi:hypothetical protein